MEMENFRPPQIRLETIRRAVLVTDARNSSKAYFAEKADEALVRIERDRALFAQIASLYGGEEVRDRGDGSMFVFLDPLNAMRAALSMQVEVRRLNQSLPIDALHLTHRMGLHVGEVKVAITKMLVGDREVERQKISGDIVVTTARLEAICHPGEVCFSNEVYRAVHDHIEHPFRFLDATLKGFDRPVRCWSSRLDLEWARPMTAEEEQDKLRRKEERRLREKWDRELRDKQGRKRLGRVAFACMTVSLAFAAYRIAMTEETVAKRLAHVMTAVTDPIEPNRVASVKPAEKFVLQIVEAARSISRGTPQKTDAVRIQTDQG